MDGTFAGPVPKWRDSIFSSGWHQHRRPGKLGRIFARQWVTIQDTAPAYPF
jgi:hypothetical protein